MQKLKKCCPRAAAILLSLMMMVVFVPTFAFATGGDEGITVFMTVSDKGTIAQTKDNEPMAWKAVKVKDLDNSGDYSFDEALVAAHEQFNSAEGYAASGDAESGGAVSKLWSKDSYNNLFFINGEGLPMGVKADKVSNGDYLEASINADQKYYADWISMFDYTEKTVAAGESFTLNLQGHLGMAYIAEDKINVPLQGLTVGIWSNGALQPIEGAVTDASGNVSLAIDDPGVYVVSAAGTTKGVVTEYSLFKGSTIDSPPMDAYLINDEEFDSSIGVGYTEENHGNGPYPIDEVKWVDWMEWYANQGSYPNLLYSNKFSGVDCPIIAPACIIRVPAEPEDVTLTVNNKGVLAKAKDDSAMVEKSVTVTDLNEDGKLTYDEALVAAHDAYFEGGAAAGYATAPSKYGAEVKMLWGTTTPNTLFFDNDASLQYAVDKVEVKAGDNLYASINADDVYYSDFKTSFDKTSAEAEVSKSLNVSLSGYMAMSGGKAQALSNVQVGIWNNGAFEPIEGAVTNSKGQVKVSFDAVGTYILTANGTVKGEVTDYSNWPDISTLEKDDCPTMAPYCTVTVVAAGEHVHALEATEAKKATCTEDGNSAYWTCSKCGGFFSDAEGKTAIEADSWILPKGHKLTAVKAKLATDKKAGNTAYWKCTNGCGKFFSNAAGTKEIKKNSWVVKKSKMTVKAKTVTAKAKKKTVIKKAKAFTVKNNPGKVTFKKTKGNKKITVAKNGKVTVKKGLKKGKTYKVTVKVTSAKTKKYAAITKTVTLKVKITK